MSPVKRELDDTVKAEASPSLVASEAPRLRPRVTPLPMRQMLPMTFVLLNESLCSTMLLPFVGLLVSHLNNTSADEAGYESGMLIGVFMLGQMVSAKPWGWMSDIYGRRFPLISGLFTSGLMMLGFGLSSSVWMCVIFRFFHGLFNGNVLVAKTMMADITDKTNQAKGFAFVSLCYGIGVLIGPTLGGLLYDAAKSSAMGWAHIGPDNILSRYPALLPSLVIFVYTNIGMTICTFFVMESNPKAKPLPRILKCLYPCFWREPELFVHPSSSLVTQEEAEGVRGAQLADGGSEADENSEDSLGTSIQRAESLVANVSMTRAVASLMIASPVRREDRRFDALVAAETLTTATPQTTAVTPRYGQSTLSRMMDEAATLEDDASQGGPRDDDEERENDKSDGHEGVARRAAAGKHTLSSATASSSHRERAEITGKREALGLEDSGDMEGGVVFADDEKGQVHGDAAVAVPENSETVLKSFGYRQAFASPVTRMMLILYMLLSAADMTGQEILPLWAIASVSVGGLGFRADKVGYIILTNSVPCVAANLLFHKACTHYDNKLSLYRLSVACCCASICFLPFISYFDLGSYVFFAVVVCTSVRQFFASWAYGLVTMLTARSAPDGHVGSIMGINQSCGALTRTLAPFLVTPLFAWSLTSHHPFPFDHTFVFLLSTLVFAIGAVYSVWLRTDADARLEVVHENPVWMNKLKDMAVSCYQMICQALRKVTACCRSSS